MGYLTLTWAISCGTDPLVHHGRHFGRTVHVMCSVNALINNGILRMGELRDQPEETFTHEYVMFIWFFWNNGLTRLTQGAQGTPGISTASSNHTRPRGSYNGRLRQGGNTYGWTCSYTYIPHAFGGHYNLIRIDTERRFQCEIRRHEKPERRSPRLDHPSWPTSESSIGT